MTTALVCEFCGAPAEWRLYDWTTTDLPASHACDSCHQANKPTVSINKGRMSWRRLAGGGVGKKTNGPSDTPSWFGRTHPQQGYLEREGDNR